MTSIQLKPISQQVVAVIGASSGIGRETALQFAKKGAKVAVSARSEAGLQSLVDEISGFGGAAINTPFYNKAKTKLGVKPTGLPPYYAADLVAQAIVHVAENPTRDIIVGDSGRVLDLLQKVSPHLVDALMTSIAIDGQHTKTTKYETDPNNLYEPIEGYDRATGDFSHLAIPGFLDWLDFHPAAKWTAIAGVGAIALMITSALSGDKS